jgi:hypothetical protein
MARLAKLSSRFIGEGGFSIGITDVTPAAALLAEKAATIKHNYATCDDLISQFRDGTLELLPGCDEDQSLEVCRRLLPSSTAASLWRQRGFGGDAAAVADTARNAARPVRPCGHAAWRWC